MNVGRGFIRPLDSDGEWTEMGLLASDGAFFSLDDDQAPEGATTVLKQWESTTLHLDFKPPPLPNIQASWVLKARQKSEQLRFLSLLSGWSVRELRRRPKALDMR